MDDVTIENGRILSDVSDLQPQVVRLQLQTDNIIKKYEFTYGKKAPMWYQHHDECDRIEERISVQMLGELDRVTKRLYTRTDEQVRESQRAGETRERDECNRSSSLEDELRMNRDKLFMLQMLSNQSLQ